MTAVSERTAAPAGPPPRRPHRAVALLRTSWRQLTSMRTALVLLFLLAVAAVPGSVLPQRTVAPEQVAGFYRDNPQLAPVLGRLGGFDVYASAWFAAVYLLLFTSLVGCVLPRLAEHVRALRGAPPPAPRRLDRLPQHAPAAPHPAAPADAARRTADLLRRRRWRTAVRTGDDGTVAVSAEKGYLKETGNLLFHAALLAVLVGAGFGSWYGWHGNRLLVQGADTRFCNSLPQLDESALGARVDAADLPRFCLELTRFDATYQPSGLPRSFTATVAVREGDGGWQPERRFTVNDPLRLDGAAVHLLGHGYAPVLRYTDRYGQQQTTVVPFLVIDGQLTSEGAAAFPDANVDPRTGERRPGQQVGFEGVYVPTVDPAGGPRSVFPAERSPVLFLTAYRGDLGVDSGVPGTVYALDRARIGTGALRKVSGDRPHELRPGQSWKLDDGTTLEFLGTRRYATLAVRHDPLQPVVLAGAVLALIGLTLSLVGHRRRVWFRYAPPGAAAGAPGGSVVEAGGLPRTDFPGFAEEFARVSAAARDEGTA